MRFEQLQQHVARAEKRVELRSAQSSLYWTILKDSWREGWTPGRIVIAGVVSGFLVGRAEPLRSLTGARWMQMFTAVSSFLATAQAAAAAETAEQAADTARELMALFDADRLIIRKLGRGATSALRVHELMQRRPMITIRSASKELHLSVPTVNKALELMTSAGIVRETTGKRWGRLFAYSKYLALLDKGTEPLPA